MIRQRAGPGTFFHWEWRVVAAICNYRRVGFLPSTGIVAVAIGILCILVTYGMPLIDHLNQSERTKQESLREAHERSMDATFSEMRSAFGKIESDTMRAHEKRQEEVGKAREQRRE